MQAKKEAKGKKSAPSADTQPSVRLDTARMPGDGRVELPLPAYHDLLDAGATRTPPAPAPLRYAVLRADYRGVVGKEHTRFACVLELRVFAEGWTEVPLFGDELAVTALAVTEAPQPTAGGTAAKPAADKPAGADVDADADADADVDGAPAVTLVGGYQQMLLVSRPGHYTVRLDILAGFRGEAGRSGLRFAVPRAAITRLELALPRTGVDVTVKRALQSECHELDEAAERGEDEPAGAFTRVTAQLAPTDTLQIEWTQAIEPVEAEAAPVRPVVTGDVDTLVSVGEGLLLCQSRVEMDVVQGQMARFRYVLPSDVNVLAVSCPAAKTWRVREAARGASAVAGDTAPADSGDASAAATAGAGATTPAGSSGDGEGLGLAAPTQMVEVNLSHDVSGRHEVHLVYERRMADTSGTVRVPVLDVLDVDRQRGHIGVEARTNVEVAVADQEAVGRVDVQELPRDVTNLAQNPLLFGFKYLRAPYVVDLTIHKHQDVEVLVASIDLACVEATLVEAGKLETKCVFKVRNNQQQFLRLRLPANSTVWSSFVSHAPVKPASDAKTGELLIPLTKSQVVEDLQHAFPVELVYLTELPKLAAAGGELRVGFPQVDVPIHHVLVQLHVPKEYRYDQFGGTMQHVRQFSRAFEMDVAPKPPAGQVGARPMPQLQIAVQTNVALDDMLTESQAIDPGMLREFAEEPAGYLAPLAKRGGTAFGFGGSSKGILPVKLDVPKIGEVLRFEQLLVLDEPAAVTTRVRKRRHGWFGRG